VTDSFRLVGAAGSALGNLALFALIAAVPSGWCGHRACRGFVAPARPAGDLDLLSWISLEWEPYVEEVADADESRCPEPVAAPGSTSILQSSLPLAYDPSAYPSRDVYACVKVNAAGGVDEAKILSGTGRPAVDRALAGSFVRGGWLFSASTSRRAAWVRVRLNRRAPQGLLL